MDFLNKIIMGVFNLRLKKIEKKASNHELQLFFEELSRIKVDVLANYENLKALIEWCNHMEIDEGKKQQLISELNDAEQQFGSMCKIVFKEKNNRVQKVLNDVSDIARENNQKQKNWLN